jgi:hypothetical protein
MWVVWFSMQHHKAFDFSRGLFTETPPGSLPIQAREKWRLTRFKSIAFALGTPNPKLGNFYNNTLACLNLPISA